MHWVYIIQSLTSNRYYIGSSSNLEQRLIDHNSGKNQSTRNEGPYKFIYTEKYETKTEALQRELKIKSYK